jgi:hypothetical protein
MWALVIVSITSSVISGRVAQDIQHGSEAFLAGDFLEIASALCGDLGIALRESAIKNVKI